MDKRYEDFENLETWSVAMVIDNDPASLTIACGFPNGPALPRETVRVAQLLRGWITERTLAGGELTVALVTAALARVNWQELAEHYIAKWQDGVR